eukprot:gnl/TRDRNA2_/TRDRNA2_63161_c0_seq2.p1 gnl/TRDRNA2_/TRDRNA2_63161_c0~~gnl/TRDRNA2_/TRDRNA2_63161_c0_seq2.p1  ORF type:complete len:368 (+),score=53.08 gnl/TRDRNA2_/TRDRNA2_63161_c0_seq2:79-1182(+)
MVWACSCVGVLLLHLSQASVTGEELAVPDPHHQYAAGGRSLPSFVAPLTPSDAAGQSSPRAAQLPWIPVASASALPMERMQDSCACLNWRETYMTRGVKCGSGHETLTNFGLGQADETISFSNQEFCDGFYERIDDNFCVNTHIGTSPKQWCYVSTDSCYGAQGHALEGSEPRTSLKLCSSNDDVTLASMPPGKLNYLARKHRLDINLLAKLSYPTWEPENWLQVGAFYGQWTFAGLAQQASSKLVERLRGTKTDLAGLATDTHARLEALVDSGRPMLFPPMPGQETFGVTMGTKAYEFRRTLDSSGGNTNFDGVTELVCVQGCENEAVARVGAAELASAARAPARQAAPRVIRMSLQSSTRGLRGS